MLSPLSYSRETESYRVKLICWRLRARIQTQVSSALVYLGSTLKRFSLKTVISLYSMSSTELVERNPSQEVARSTYWNNGALSFPPALLAKEATWYPLVQRGLCFCWPFSTGGFIELLAGLENWLVDRLKSYIQLLLVDGCDKLKPHWDLPRLSSGWFRFDTR